MYNKHSKYSITKTHELIASQDSSYKFNEEQYESYESFANNVPIQSKEMISSFVEKSLKISGLSGCSYSLTSGTTGMPKLLLNSIWRKGQGVEYAKHLRLMLKV